jgi:hypothetical protein
MPTPKTTTTAAPAPAPATTPPVDHSGHQTTTAPPPGTPAMGLAYDPARIPAGDPGVGFVNLRTTGEKPGVDPDGIGAFRTVCQYSHMRPDDPIVKPGQPGASHLHTFWGNTLTNANSTAESILGSGNGTCRGGTVNRTAYWAPSIIDTRTGTPIAPELIHVYYKSGYDGIRPQQIEPLPPGLRMVAGNAMASGPQARMDWNCWSDGSHRQATIPTCPANDQIAMNINFPQCWNGALDSPDHKSHLAYPSNGSCPSTHPRALPAISYHLLFKVPADVSAWRLSSDMYDSKLPGGYSLHGDWFNGWDNEVLKVWTQLCVRTPATTCGSHMIGDGRVMV